MSSNNHIVQRITVLLNLPDNNQSGQTRSDLLQFIRSVGKDELKRTFDEVCPSHETIRVDKIKLNLGVVDRASLHQKLSKELTRSISQAILAAKQGKKEVDRGQISIDYGQEQAGRDSVTYTLSAAPNDYWESFAHFLKTGSVAWWTRLNDQMSPQTYFEQYCIQQGEKRERESQITASRELLWNILSKNKSTLKRLVFQMDLKQIDRFLIEKGHQISVNHTELHDWLQEFISGRIQHNKKVAQRLLRIAEMQFYLKPKKGTNEQIKQWVLRLFTKELIIHASSKKKVIKEVQNWISGFRTRENSPSLIGETNQLNALLYALEREGLECFPTVEELSIFDSDNRKLIQLNDAQIETQLNESMEIEQSTEDHALNFGIQLNYAGVVILWPMLTTFFGRLGLTTSKNVFNSSEHQVKALKLLNYLVAKSDDLPEYEMPLNKVLCGIPITEPFFNHEYLSKIEKEEAEDLMKHVIEAWSVLKSTSPEGLRQAFIARKGELIDKGDHWFLKVEENSIDIILSKLPWGYSMIKLPWMEKIIQVEW